MNKRKTKWPPKFWQGECPALWPDYPKLKEGETRSMRLRDGFTSKEHSVTLTKRNGATVIKVVRP